MFYLFHRDQRGVIHQNNNVAVNHIPGQTDMDGYELVDPPHNLSPLIHPQQPVRSRGPRVPEEIYDN